MRNATEILPSSPFGDKIHNVIMNGLHFWQNCKKVCKDKSLVPEHCPWVISLSPLGCVYSKLDLDQRSRGCLDKEVLIVVKTQRWEHWPQAGTRYNEDSSIVVKSTPLIYPLYRPSTASGGARLSDCSSEHAPLRPLSGPAFSSFSLGLLDSGMDIDGVWCLSGRDKERGTVGPQGGPGLDMRK